MKATRCAVCGLDPVRYPDHRRTHVGRRVEIDARHVAQVEAENLALRDSLGLPPTIAQEEDRS